MALTIGIPRETAAGETRVSMVPNVADRLLTMNDGLDIVVEAGAGEHAYHDDADYEEAGCRVADREEVLSADVVTKVAPPSDEELDAFSDGQVLIGLLDPLGRAEAAQTLADAGVTALSMELVPRISRAQKMDALSVMSSIGGYRAAIRAAEELPKFFPLLTTAAGTNAVEAMEPGSVIMDLAAPNGGNCVHTKADETVVEDQVTIIGPTNLPAEMPVDASQLYAKTISAMIEEFVEEGSFQPDFDDDIFDGACLTHDGTVHNDRVRGLLEEEAGDEPETVSE